MTPISIRVRELREQRGWTQAHLSQLAGVTEAALSRIENGQTTGIDFQTLEKLAKALDVHPAVLIVKKGKVSEATVSDAVALRPPALGASCRRYALESHRQTKREPPVTLRRKADAQVVEGNFLPLVGLDERAGDRAE